VRTVLSKVQTSSLLPIKREREDHFVSKQPSCNTYIETQSSRLEHDVGQYVDRIMLFMYVGMFLTGIGFVKKYSTVCNSFMRSELHARESYFLYCMRQDARCLC
jgi:hypothetical protein